MPGKTGGVRDRRGHYDGPILVLVTVVILAVAGFAVADVSARSVGNSSPNTQAELVPPGIHVVRLTRCVPAGGMCVWTLAGPGRPRVAVTNPGVITQLRNAFNSLPVQLPGHGSPGCDASVVTVAFSRSVKSPPVFAASITCRVVSITYAPGAKHQPPPEMEDRALAKALLATNLP